MKKPRKLKAVAGTGAEIDADTLALERDLGAGARPQSDDPA